MQFNFLSDYAESFKVDNFCGISVSGNGNCNLVLSEKTDNIGLQVMWLLSLSATSEFSIPLPHHAVRRGTLRYLRYTRPTSASCPRLLIFRCPLKQMRAATQRAGEARQTHVSSTTQLRRFANFFHRTRAFLC